MTPTPTSTSLGLKKVMQYVSDSQHHDLGDALTGVPLLALYVGVAVHLLGHVAFRRRNIGTWNPHRSAVAVVLLVAVAGAGGLAPDGPRRAGRRRRVTRHPGRLRGVALPVRAGRGPPPHLKPVRAAPP
ncbi:MAG: low temperature requirement protein A [Frankiaceae bacterium]